MSSTAPKPTLRLDWCTHAAAKYAVENWHYSRAMPAGKLVKVGVWEGGKFIGCVLFGRGATANIGSPYGVAQTDICELVRVALTEHTTPVSRILSVAIRFLRAQSPGLRLLVSYADTEQNHHGGIYQANGWLYAGRTENGCKYVVNGTVYHPKTLHSLYGVGGQSVPWLRAHVDRNAIRVQTPGKHRYLMPLDDAMRAQIAPLAKPYPKRSTCAETSTRDGAPVAVGGATPTSALP